MCIRNAKFGPGGPAGLNIQAQPFFCGARTKSAGLMLGSRVAISMYYILAAGLPAVLERCLLAGCRAHLTPCGAGLGSGLAIR